MRTYLFSILLSVAARIPIALLPAALLAGIGLNTGSLFAAGAAAGVALIGWGIASPVAGGMAERFGQRAVLLATALVHVLMLVLLITALDHVTMPAEQRASGLVFTLVISFSFLAGLSLPAVPVFSRTRWWFVHQRIPATGLSARRLLKMEAGIDDAVLIAAPLLVGILGYTVGPTGGLLCSALLTAIAVPLYAMDKQAGLMEEQTVQPEEDTHEDGVVEAVRVPVASMEHAQWMLFQARGLAPAAPGEPVVPEEPPAGPGWLKTMPGILITAAGLGMVLAGLWLTVLGTARHAGEGMAFAFLLVLAALSAVVTSRWLPARFSALPAAPRRRLFSALLALNSIILFILALTLPSTLFSLGIQAVLSVLIGCSVGVLVVELHDTLSQKAPAHNLVSVLSISGGALLLGLAAGTTAAGILEDDIGSGWGSLVALLGSLLVTLIALWPQTQPSSEGGSQPRDTGPRE